MQMKDLLDDEWFKNTEGQLSLIDSKKKKIETVEINPAIAIRNKNIKVKNVWDLCKKCESLVEKKIPKHTKKTLQKKYYYEYYLHCPNCKTNYMLPEAKRDIRELKI